MKDIDKFKEAEHIYHVTLKNNRSFEVVKNFIETIAAFYDDMISKYLEKMKEEGKIVDVPDAPLKRISAFLKLLPNEKLREYVEEYKMLRKCLISSYEVINEHRRNMKIIFRFDSNEIVITTKKLKEILIRAKEFKDLIKNYL